MSSNILIGDKKIIDECKKKGAIDGKNSVILNPAGFNLYTQEQMDAIGSYDAGKDKGISDVTSNPAAYNLYTRDVYEISCKAHKVRVRSGMTNATQSNNTGKGTFSYQIYVDDVLKKTYTEENATALRDLPIITVGG
jgi:hypothetical protein